MALDTSEGWCCKSGMTHKEHRLRDGECCQPSGTKLSSLPKKAQAKARARLEKGKK